MKTLYRIFYRTILFASISLARFFSKFRVKVPGRWMYLSEIFAALSSMMYCKLSELDEEVSEVVIEKEDIIRKKIGDEKFYSEEEIEQIKENC